MTVEEAYRFDLAYIHDTGYGGLARDAADRLMHELARAGHTQGTVVDLGCGSGVLAQQLLAAGYRVVGTDISSAMITLARRRAPEGEFHVGSFVPAPVPDCVAVTAIGEVLTYAFDPANDEEARRELFERVFRALAPGGLWLFDIAGLERARVPERTFAEGPGWTVTVSNAFDRTTAVLTRRITSFRQAGRLYRRDVETHRLVLLNPEGVLEALRAAGFEADVIPGYGGGTEPQGVVVVLARKPSRIG